MPHAGDAFLCFSTSQDIRSIPSPRQPPVLSSRPSKRAEKTHAVPLSALGRSDAGAAREYHAALFVPNQQICQSGGALSHGAPTTRGGYPRSAKSGLALHKLQSAKSFSGAK